MRSINRTGGLLVSLLIVTSAAAGTFAYLWNGMRMDAAQKVVVQKDATRFLIALTTFTPSSIDKAFNTVQSFGTGDFAAQANRFFNSTIRTELETARATSRGQVRNLYIQSLDRSRVSLYAVVDQTYSNIKIGMPAADVLRLVVDMRLTQIGWKVADLTVLQAPVARQ